jgi:hypothetical protein
MEKGHGTGGLGGNADMIPIQAADGGYAQTEEPRRLIS